MLQRLVATQFERFMGSGRTSPALFGCERVDGTPCGEYVVKLKGAIADSGLINELLGNRLAAHFGVPIADCAAVHLEHELAVLVAGIRPEKASLVMSSVGINFGTKVLAGFITWPVDKRVPEELFQIAVDIFAFDALIQNPDRRQANPNLFTKGSSIVVYDHEAAFSFLLDIFPTRTPWLLTGQRYLRDHAFYRQLKSKTIDLSWFMERLGQLTDQAIDGLFAEIPDEWNNEVGLRIREHLGAVRDHAEEFAEELRRFLV